VQDRVNRMVYHWNNVMALNRVCPAPYNAMLDGLTYIGIMNVYRGTETLQLGIVDLRAAG